MFKKLTENIYYTMPHEDTDRPVMGYIRGKRLSLMVECGNSAQTVEKFNSALKDLGFKAADMAVATHYHWDHCFGMTALKKEGTLTVASDETNALLEDMSGWEWSKKHLDEYVDSDRVPLFCKPHIMNEYPDLSQIRVCPADISFREKMTVDLGDMKCIFQKIVNPHTEDGIIVYIPSERAVFFGDCLCEELVRDQWIDNKEKLAAMIGQLENLDFDWGLEGHFPPKPKKQIMGELRERLDRLDSL